jgi:tRNA A-37 threonylcarbamoyl transferase component Bud32
MYEVLRPIAAGHQGVVHLARGDDGRLVALKRLNAFASESDRDTAERRLRREAELLGGLDVAGVVPLLDVLEEDGPGGPEIVLVMPYLPGGTLQRRLQDDGVLPAARLGELAVPLLEAVAALHRRGVLHRDIKPSNVLFDAAAGGRPWLVDFGIGTSRDVTQGLSADGHLLGTPSFIAPERARGEAGTPASDIYSLGATLRFALSGMPPHGIGDVVSVIARAAAGRIEPLPPDTPRHVVDALDRMCALDPSDRPTAAELLPGPQGTLVAPTMPTPPPPTPPMPVATGSPRGGATRIVAAAVAAVLLLVVGVGLGVTLAGRDDDDGRAAAGAEETVAGAGDETSPTSAATTPTTSCVDLPYQPCGATSPAPGTDGTECTGVLVDHDDDPTNGCEATPDDIDDAELTDGRIEGTIVPVGDVDKVLVPLRDGWQLFCDAQVRLLLTAPEGLDLEMEIFDDGDGLGTAVAPGGQTAIVTMDEPSCAQDDSTTLEVVIRGVGGRSADAWVLEKEGSW